MMSRLFSMLTVLAAITFCGCWERHVETRNREEYGRHRVTVAEEIAGTPRYEKQNDKEWRAHWLQRKRELRERRRREVEARMNVQEGLVDDQYLLKKKKRTN